jgi:uncharacterized membrane protein YphA (DoxX/SURF4 family)
LRRHAKYNSRIRNAAKSAERRRQTRRSHRLRRVFSDLIHPFVGIVDIVCGVLAIAGLFPRLAAIPLIIITIVAIISNKILMLLGHDFWIFHLPELSRYGFWSMAHESRSDLTMLLGCIYLLIEGAGTWSIDARHYRQQAQVST